MCMLEGRHEVVVWATDTGLYPDRLRLEVRCENLRRRAVPRGRFTKKEDAAFRT